MKTLILAGGFGIGLREIFHGRPKHLIPINGRPFLHYIIKLLRRNDLSDLVLAVGYLSNQIIDEFGDGSRFDVSITYSVDNRPLGTAGSIKNAVHLLKEDFMVVNGDTYIDLAYQKIIAFHKENQADVTLVGTTKHKAKGLMLHAKNKELVKLDKSGKLGNVGIYILKPSIFSLLARGERSSLEQEVLPLALKKKKRIFVYETNQEYYDIGNPEHYREAEQQLGKDES